MKNGPQKLLLKSMEIILKRLFQTIKLTLSNGMKTKLVKNTNYIFINLENVLNNEIIDFYFFYINCSLIKLYNNNKNI